MGVYPKDLLDPHRPVADDRRRGVHRRHRPPDLSLFFVFTGVGFGLYIFLIFLPLILLFTLHYCYQKHPVNFVLLGLFTVAISFAVGLTCAFTSGKVILEAAILMAVMVVGLTLYTIWATKRGHDFSFLCPFLFAAVLVFIPLGKISVMIYGAVAAGVDPRYTQRLDNEISPSIATATFGAGDH